METGKKKETAGLSLGQSDLPQGNADSRQKQGKAEPAAVVRTDEAWYQTLFNNVGEAILVYWGQDVLTGKPGNFIAVNDAACQWLGFTREELLRLTPGDVDVLETMAQVPAYVERLKKDREAVFEGVHITRDGRRQPVDIHSRLFYKDSKELVLSAVRDITERKQIEKVLQKSRERYLDLFENANDVIMILDENNNFQEVNKKAVDLSEYSREELLTMNIFDLIPEETRLRERKSVRAVKKEGKREPHLASMKTKHGHILNIEVSASAIYEGDRYAGMRAIFRDITERKRMEEEIRDMSMRDQLTGLFNRRGFIVLAEQLLKAAQREKRPMRLVFIDTDGLKWINDHLGHKEGDKVLNDTADILRQTFRQSDIIARVGGDEFAVLVSNAADINQATFFLRLQQNIADLNAKERRQYELAMSWGSVNYDPEAPQSLERLMSAADELMYAQKKTKGNYICR